MKEGEGGNSRACSVEVSLLLMFLLKRYTIEIRRDVIFILMERFNGSDIHESLAAVNNYFEPYDRLDANMHLC